MTATVEMVFLGEDHEPIWEQAWPLETPSVGDVVCLAERTVDAFDLPTRFWSVIYVQHDLAHDAPPLLKRVLLEDRDAVARRPDGLAAEDPNSHQELGAAITDPGDDDGRWG